MDMVGPRPVVFGCLILLILLVTCAYMYTIYLLQYMFIPYIFKCKYMYVIYECVYIYIYVYV